MNGFGGLTSDAAAYLRPFRQYANRQVILRMPYQTLGGDSDGNA